jgi:hypothetical protein
MLHVKMQLKVAKSGEEIATQIKEKFISKIR